MIQAKSGAPSLDIVAPQGQARSGGGRGGDGDFAETLKDKQREVGHGSGADTKAKENRTGREHGENASKSEENKEKSTQQTTEEQRAEDKARRDKEAEKAETAKDRDKERQQAVEQAQKELAAAEAEAAGKAKSGEDGQAEDGKELPQEEQVVAGLVISQAAKEGARKGQAGEVDGPAGRESVRPRVLEAVADTTRGKGNPGERGGGSEADRRFFQGLQERLGEQRAMQDGESLVKNASKQDGERNLQNFLRTLQQANARDTGSTQPTQSQAGAVSPTATPTGQNAPATPTTMTLQTPVNQEGWDRALGERVAWMAKDGMQEARIQLHPRNMGPIEVRLSVNQDQASVHFTAQHGMTRDAIEQAMPRLREMLADQGLNLADSEVADQGPQGREQTGEGLAGGGGDSDRGDGLLGQDGDPEADGEAVQAGEAVIAPSGLDHYA